MSTLTKVLEALDEVNQLPDGPHKSNAQVCLAGVVSALQLLEDEGGAVVGSNDLPLVSGQELPASGTVVAGEPGNGEGNQ